MNARRWEEIQATFDTLVELDDVERGNRLTALSDSDPELLAAVELLLAADSDADARLAPLEAFFLPESAAATDPLALAGQTVSHFQIHEAIGSGGMGGSSRLPRVRRPPIVAFQGLTGNEWMVSSSSDVTALLQRWSAGDESARDQLIPLVYDGLRELAHRRLWGAPLESSLSTTELVHEAYIKLVDARRVDLPSRANFLALASEVMRNLLVDRARGRLAAKRGSGVRPLALDEQLWVSDENLDTVADLDDALQRLAKLKPRQAQLLQHRYFGGLTLEESAAATGVSLATAKRELRFARAWLALELKGEPLA